MMNVHPIRTLQHLAKDGLSESLAIDEIAFNLPRYTNEEIAKLFIRAAQFETAHAANGEKDQALTDLVLMGEDVVEDFMPNIGKCALQDYGRLNDFLIAAAALRKEVAA